MHVRLKYRRSNNDSRDYRPITLLRTHITVTIKWMRSGFSGCPLTCLTFHLTCDPVCTPALNSSGAGGKFKNGYESFRSTIVHRSKFWSFVFFSTIWRYILNLQKNMMNYLYKHIISKKIVLSILILIPKS